MVILVKYISITALMCKVADTPGRVALVIRPAGRRVNLRGAGP
ncbi:MAG: hypothetical protein ACRC5Q_08405 [Culicoidibacterales bacterium]